jgi:hypothetical protein
MKIAAATVLLSLMAGTTSAFSPQSRAFLASTSTEKLPAAASAASASAAIQHNLHHPKKTLLHMAEQEDANVSLDDEVEEMFQAEMTKSKRISNLRNPNGVEYAPWMNISKEDETKIRSLSREKAVARRKRQEQEMGVQGTLLKDSQAQELGGLGLRSKIVDGNSVELEWATSSEAATQGFIVKRRPAKTEDFDVLASYEDFGPLASKGKDGGVYRYMDKNVAPGGWVYRVTEREADGSENDLSQCLVDVITEEEQRGAVVALAGLGLVAVLSVVAGTLLDPLQ